MKKFQIIVVPLILIAAVLALVSYDKSKKSAWNRIKNPETVQILKEFVAVKKAQAFATTNEVPPEISALFKQAQKGDWLTLSNSFWKLGERRQELFRGFSSGPPPHEEIWKKIENFVSDLRGKIGWRRDFDEERRRLSGTPWEAAKEVWGAFNGFVEGNEKYSTEFGRNIIDSIPDGSIYFGGSDPGRFIVTAMCKSQPEGDPFFTLTQNAVVDGTYLDYLRSMFGRKIYIPTEMDARACFQEYARRKSLGSTNGQIEVTGQGEVMVLNGLIAKTFFEQNTNRQFFIEESFPLDWMYPHLEPHGLIFKINRQPLAEMSEEIVQLDRDYWLKSLEPKIGGWFTNEATVKNVAAFVKKIFIQYDYTGFTGDIQFVQNVYSCKMFSKERSSIAALYAWRAGHSTNDSEKQRMVTAADFAFRQAWVLCPYSPEVVYRYINFLIDQGRLDDAILVAETMAGLPQNKDNYQIAQLPAQLKNWKKESPLKSTK